MICACCGGRISAEAYTAKNGQRVFYCCSQRCLDIFCHVGDLVLGKAADPLMDYLLHHPTMQ